MPQTLGEKITKEYKYMSPYQTQVLLKRYQAKPYLEKEEGCQLAQSLGISQKRIRHWFSMRRYRNKRNAILHRGE